LADDNGNNLPSVGEKRNDYKSDSYSLRQEVFELLERNHELTAKHLCQILRIPYETKGNTVRNYRHDWKCNYRNRLGLKCLEFHGARGWLYGFRGLDRSSAVAVGWVATKARNRMFVWKDLLGRIEWFETGRVNVFVRKPASEGRLKQLLANAFMWTGLIHDVRLFEAWVKTYRRKGAHATVDLGERLPYCRVDFLKDSNGVVVKTGDLSHPTAIEIEFCYPDFSEKNELVLKQFTDVMSKFLGLGGGSNVNGKDKDESYVR